jgi:acyl-CoA reductase-like NAD-dependent aldehyde dehydrogenase
MSMREMQSFHSAAEQVKTDGRAYIAGRRVAAISGEVFPTINPATGRKLADIAAGNQADVDRAVKSAREVFESGVWSRMAPKERKKILLRWASLIESNLKELAILEVLDCGKPISDALNVDLPESVETLRWHAEAIDKLYDQVAPSPSDIVALIVREPIGVVGAVLPWNFPIFVAMWKLAPALAGGNSIVVKPAEQTSLTCLRLAELAVEAGVPPGAFNVVPGFGEIAGQALGRHGDVDCISFTGSGEVGRLFLRYSAESNLKRVVLECGGKSPAIVLDDVKDLAPVAQQLAVGILFCQGENCSAGSRLIVHQDIKDRLLTELLCVFNQWKVGDPLSTETRVGAMISAEHLARVLGFIGSGRAEGASLVTGGLRILAETGGFFVAPTIFDEVRPSMTIAREEIFGPVLSVLTFKDINEAIRVANDTSFGLASSLYTDDLHNAHWIARELRAGTVSVNCFSEGDTGVPFGGYKQSGFGGRDKSFAAHDQYLETKTIWMQLRKPGVTA